MFAGRHRLWREIANYASSRGLGGAMQFAVVVFALPSV